MIEVLRNVYISHWSAVQDHFSGDAPKDEGWFVVNCTKDLPMAWSTGTRLDVNDDRRDDLRDQRMMTEELPRVVNCIDRELRRGNNVVVHCLAGRQRSATVVCAYLMLRHGMTVDAAVAYLKNKKRDVFFTGMNFRESLEAFHARVNP
jgi:hypothetical protein